MVVQSLGAGQFAYQYDSNEDISQYAVTDEYGQTYQATYTYNEINQLASVTDLSYNRWEKYDYDKAGNRVKISGYAWPCNYTYNYTYDSSERLQFEEFTGKTNDPSYTTTYQYDANGNLLSTDQLIPGINETITTYQYDYENRPIQVTKYSGITNTYTENHFYNGDGQLMGMNYGVNNGGGGIAQQPGTRYQYDHNSIIADRDGAGALIASYNRMGNRMFSQYSKYPMGGDVRDTFYVFGDILDTNDVFVRPNQTIQGFNIRYAPFQVFGPSTAGNVSRFTFTGAPYFSGIGLYQMGARFYNPTIGRFITRDTYRGNIYQPWTQNLYTYCNNNPINFVDPTGHTFYGITYQNNKDSSYETIKTEYDNLTSKIENEKAILDGKYSIKEKVSASFNLAMYKEQHQILNELVIVKGDNYTQEDKERANQTILDLEKQEFDEQYEMAMGVAGGGVKNVATKVSGWLGKGARMIINKYGDHVFISEDGCRRIRFDINNPSPHNNPHGHVEEFINGQWQKSGPLYPTDVPQN